MTQRPAPTPERYLGATEVAALFHVEPKTITRWAKEGKLPHLRTLGGHRRYPEREIHALARQLAEESNVASWTPPNGEVTDDQSR